jgi:hypothetical protein
LPSQTISNHPISIKTSNRGCAPCGGSEKPVRKVEGTRKKRNFLSSKEIPLLDFENAEMEHKKNILIGCTGSVAAIKLPVVLNLLKKRDQTFQVSLFCGSLIFPCRPLGANIPFSSVGNRR